MADDPDEASGRVDRAIDSIHLSIQDIRNFIFGLRPELLEGTCAGGGLAALVEEYRHNTIIDLELARPRRGRCEPTDEVTSQLLAIVREALSNVVRHSRASRAFVELTSDDRGGLRPRHRGQWRRTSTRPRRPPGPPGSRQHAASEPPQIGARIDDSRANPGPGPGSPIRVPHRHVRQGELMTDSESSGTRPLTPARRRRPRGRPPGPRRDARPAAGASRSWPRRAPSPRRSQAARRFQPGPRGHGRPPARRLGHRGLPRDPGRDARARGS